ncbi:MAG TPA: aldo/keto reductase [Devosiaceae bacterium]
MFGGQPVLTLNDGIMIPQLGFGVWQVEDKTAPAAVGEALKVGYRLIDTAQGYDNEQGVGEAFRASGLGRDDVFITTKLRNREQGYDATLRAFDQSMQKLGLDVLDLFLIHWPLPDLNTYVETWKAFVKLKADGRIRSIGVSNFNPSHLERIIGETGVTPSVNQIELHPRFQQRAVRDFHAEHGITIESWSPLGQGKVLSDPVIQAIAEKYGRSAAQVILRWHLEQGLIAIPKSVTPSRIAENFEIFDFSLDAEDMAQIDALDDPNGKIGPDPETFHFKF